MPDLAAPAVPHRAAGSPPRTGTADADADGADADGALSGLPPGLFK